LRLEARPTIREPFENPAVPLSSVALDGIFGNSAGGDAGESVTPDTALALPVVMRCVALIAGLLAGCRMNVYQNPGKTLMTVPALDPENVDTLYTQYELWELVTSHLLLWGNAYVLKVKNGAGQVIDLRPINPSRVTVKLDRQGNKIFLVKAAGSTVAQPDVYTTKDVMHIPGLGYDGIVGLSPISYAKQTISTAIASDKLAARFYSQGTMLSGILKTAVPLAGQGQADEMKRRWSMKNSGAGNAGNVAVLDSETDFIPLTIPPDQLQFLNSRQWSVTELARIYGVPPWLVNDMEKSTSWGTGIEEQNTAFVTYTLGNWANRIEQRVTREVILSPNKTAEFDFSNLTRGDTAERFNGYATGVQWGFLTRNEARLQENLQPIDGLDQPLTPINMVAGQVKLDPVTGQPTSAPKGDLNGPLTSNVVAGSGKTQALDENS
jgi:HK97 family phage portal protein